MTLKMTKDEDFPASVYYNAAIFQITVSLA